MNAKQILKVRVAKAKATGKPLVSTPVVAPAPAPKLKLGVNRTKDGLNVRDQWTKLFLANEAAWKAGKKKAILTDEQIADAMRAAFPGRTSAVFGQVHMVRGRYNRNGNNPNGTAPKVQSHRYVRDGAKVRQCELGERIHELCSTLSNKGEN